MDYSAMSTEMFKKLSVIVRSNSQKQIGGFFSGEMFILNYLHNAGGTALPSELGSNMCISSARIAAILKSLERKGLIDRKTDDSDRRKIKVTISELGINNIMEKRKILHGYMERLLSELGESDTNETIRLLDRIIEITKRNQIGLEINK